MGSVYKRGDMWWIDYRLNGARKREAVSKNKKEAQQALLVVEAEILQRRFGVQKQKSIRLQKIMDEFLEWAKVNRSNGTYRRYKYACDVVLRDFGNPYIKSIAVKDIEAYKTKRLKIVERKTVSIEVALLSRIFNFAIKLDKLNYNPVQKTEKIKFETKEPVYLLEYEWKILFEKCFEFDMGPNMRKHNPHYQKMLYVFSAFGLYCGLRHEEILHVKWKHINFEDEYIHIPYAKNRNLNKAMMPTSMIEILLSIKPAAVGEYVVCRPNGSKIKTFKKIWPRFMRTVDGVPQCTPHALRHSFATALIRNGADLLSVMKAGRWESLKMVQRYAHVAPDHLARTVSRLNEVNSGHNLVTIEKLKKNTQE
jgi:integrase